MAKDKEQNKQKKPERIASNKFPLVIVPIVAVCLGIIYCMAKTATVDRERWIEVRKEKFEQDSVPLPPLRGNILSANGELLSTNLPNYKVRFDFLAGIPKDTSDAKLHAVRDSLIARKDSIFLSSLPAIAGGLSRICPALDSAGYAVHLRQGLERHARYYDVCPGWILNYIQYNQLRELPIFSIQGKYQSGLIVEERNNRKKPFGSLARRMLGEMYGAKDSARSGLELAYDTLLRGKPGIMHRRRIRSKNVEQVDLPAVDGYDLVSTIDVSMQDICETALREKLIELNAAFGVCILMETKTGDVKAIVNLAPDSAGHYYEARNYALAALMEPGSTFKTASIMVALDDGEITINDKVDTGCGIYDMYGAKMKDSNWARGGCGMLDVTYAVVRSSNIGVSRLIDEHYHNNPEKFIAGLKRVGIGAPLGLPFEGMADPRIIGPDDKQTYWSKTSLPWMSIGYGTQIPPISTVTFYNAIANGGKMVRPRFVKAISKNGEIVREFPVEVIKRQICKPQTLKEIQGILKKVVNDTNYGTGKRARSKHFSVSGKTGTAQVAVGGGYHNGRMEHLVSFCGYYPSDDPQYTCIVAIRTAAPGASGGAMAGTVFAKIAERVYSKQISTNIALACDSTASFVPQVKAGEAASAQRLLKWMNIPYKNLEGGLGGWGQSSQEGKKVAFKAVDTDQGQLPDLTGMGARDAVYAIESRGMKAKVEGVGKVRSQSMAAGTRVVKGRTVTVQLD